MHAHRETSAINGNASSNFCSTQLFVRKLDEDGRKIVLLVNSGDLTFALNNSYE